jgi:hypothetical protein
MGGWTMRTVKVGGIAGKAIEANLIDFNAGRDLTARGRALESQGTHFCAPERVLVLTFLSAQGGEQWIMKL